MEESPFFLPYQHPTIVDMQYVSHVERAVASAMLGGCRSVRTVQMSFKDCNCAAVVSCGYAPDPRYYKGYDVRKKFAHIDEWLIQYGIPGDILYISEGRSQSCISWTVDPVHVHQAEVAVCI